MLILGSPARVLQLSISHLWRVQVPRLPGVKVQKEVGEGRVRDSWTQTQWPSASSSSRTSVKMCERQFKCIHKTPIWSCGATSTYWGNCFPVPTAEAHFLSVWSWRWARSSEEFFILPVAHDHWVAARKYICIFGQNIKKNKSCASICQSMKNLLETKTLRLNWLKNVFGEEKKMSCSWNNTFSSVRKGARLIIYNCNLETDLCGCKTTQNSDRTQSTVVKEHVKRPLTEIWKHLSWLPAVVLDIWVVTKSCRVPELLHQTPFRSC